MRMLRLFVRPIDTLSEWSGRLVSILIPLTVAVITYEVVVRYAFRAPTIWAHETSIFLLGYCGMLAGAYVLKRNEHIRVDIVYGRLSPRTRAILDLITSPLFFFIMALIIYEGLKAGMLSLRINEHTASAWGPPLAHFRLIIPAGAFLLFLQAIPNWIRNLYLAIKNTELPI